MNTTQALSAPSIRYLITLNALDKEGGIRCVDIADTLGVTKPSVHRMVGILCSRGLAQKVKYGMVFLTEEGRKLAGRYTAYYDILCRYFRHTFALPSEDNRNAAFALLAGISEAGIENMCEIMQNTT